ncbi:hypothetical protein [Mangrovibacterium lignilyticum]|uniref:hypothetical protein n=1 Tax=Mangrovibacterium lignilyticum TaxID=2668052 RepID=UPI0013D561E5|nr:hypothetical protein [Mangrovibacterium lignilyticum]
MIKKSILKSLMLLFLLMLVQQSKACEVEIKILGEQQVELYKPGEIIIVEVTIVNTHRDCSEPIDHTKILTEGCKVTAATPWKEIKACTYVRKLKIQISADGGTQLQLVCKRSCDKDGGFGKLILAKKS